MPEPKYTLSDIVSGVRKVETGGQPNPFIRTKVKLKDNYSTAYGPHQITSTKLKDYLDRFSSKLSESSKTYIPAMLNQAKLFKQHYEGKLKDPRFGPGGEGILGRTPKQKGNYYKVIQDLIRVDWQDNAKGNLDKFVKLWYGHKDPIKLAKYKAKLIKAMQSRLAK